MLELLLVDLVDRWKPLYIINISLTVSEYPLTTRMAISNCPSDILITTTNFLDKRALLDLRLVNRQIYDILTPFALRAVQFNLDYPWNGDTNSVNSRLEECQLLSSDLRYYAQNFSISINGGCLSRQVDPSLIPHLWNAIASFKSLRTFDLRWDITPKRRTDPTTGIRPQAVLAGVVDAVVQATGGELQSLNLSPSPDDPWVSESDSLQFIRGLVSLKVSLDRRGWRCSLHSQPKLFTDSELERGYRNRFCGCKPFPVQDVVSQILENNPQLESLELLHGCRGRGFSLHEILLPHLSNLVSLSIFGASFHSTTPLDPIPLRNLRHLTIHSRYSAANLDVLWSSMKAAGTCLETLTTFQVSYSLMSFLASFSGLRTLSIDAIQRYTACTSEDAVSLFTHSVLPQHASTLESLSLRFDVDIYHIDAWAFNPFTWSQVLPRLVALKSLRVHPPRISGEGLVRPSDYTTYSYLLGNYQVLLDSIQEVPDLERLEVLPPSVSTSYSGGQSKWSDLFSSELDKVTSELKVNIQRGSRRVNPRTLALYIGDLEPVEGDDGKWVLRRLVSDII
ncbi:hypothetical protein BDN72DRAFT_251816 [Pluteus cervinus]|uniref:Uncharacterized protein n=1 Tax=Pluteus cervinus TaxID=181527 RepID=A0ACD3AGH8_9AGAR|nr:hypothetical protein BDN72DRAFT_251816 [Pluteus cervinus]